MNGEAEWEVRYLIAHKVRGELAFDIAIRVRALELWIIPSTGHRAYPFWWIELDELAYPGTPPPTEAPADLRDFYTAFDEYKRKPKPAPKAPHTLDDLL